MHQLDFWRLHRILTNESLAWLECWTLIGLQCSAACQYQLMQRIFSWFWHQQLGDTNTHTILSLNNPQQNKNQLKSEENKFSTILSLDKPQQNQNQLKSGMTVFVQQRENCKIRRTAKQNLICYRVAFDSQF